MNPATILPNVEALTKRYFYLKS
jgi:hypothetical protein